MPLTLKILGARLFATLVDAPIWLWLLSIATGLMAWVFPDPATKLAARAAFLAIGVDTILGFWVAWKERRVSSMGFAQLFTKLIVYLGLIILLAAALDILPLEHSFESGLMTGLLCFCFGRESLSFLENVRKLGYTVPRWLEKLFARLADQDPTKGKDIG